MHPEQRTHCVTLFACPKHFAVSAHVHLTLFIALPVCRFAFSGAMANGTAFSVDEGSYLDPKDHKDMLEAMPSDYKVGPACCG